MDLVLERDEGKPDAFCLKGISFIALMQYEGVLTCADRTILAFSSHSEGLLIRGIARGMPGQHPEARKANKQAFRFNPDLALVWYTRQGTTYW